MYVEALGVGELEVNIEADTLYTSISGQTKITFAGSVLRHELISSGVFSLNAYALDTDHTSINLLGEGDCYVTAFETLDVIISGVGNVYYLGMPVITPQINGEGEIIDRN